MTTDAPAPPGAAPPTDAAVESPDRIARDRQMIVDARREGTGSLLWVFTKLSGPGWLQSAITLGGGSLAGSLYLGVLAGYGLMWLQPLAMVMGVIMLSAIAYVTLSTGERPFGAINRHINPVLGWGWAAATLMANLVWCMPQFALGTAAIRQNLANDSLGAAAIVQLQESDEFAALDADGQAEAVAGLEFRQKLICVAALFMAAGVVVWFYDTGGWGIKVFELILKAMVGTIVVCFFVVVIKMSAGGALDWSQILAGFIPNPRLLADPSPALEDVLSRTGDFRDFWAQATIVTQQQQVMITAAATAVGINMTFLLPYSMLARGWGREFRGLAVFDLATGLFIPFVLATSCVVIAAASQFHATPEPGLIGLYSESESGVKPAGNVVGGYNALLDARISEERGADAFNQLKAAQSEFEQSGGDGVGPLIQARRDLPEGDRTIAAMLVKRDAFNLAQALEPIAGTGVAHKLFGIGVLGMAVSTIIILMLINGFVICEMLGLDPRGTPHRIGCFLAACSGALGPFIWGDAAAWLAVPTSMFGMVLLPIAYFTFFLMMNSRSLLGDALPQGATRLKWNLLMGVAAGLAAFGSFWSIRSSSYPTAGFIGLGLFILLAFAVHLLRPASGRA